MYYIPSFVHHKANICILFYSICYKPRDEENNKNICIVIRLAKYSHFNNLQHAKVSLKKSVYGSINN